MKRLLLVTLLEMYGVSVVYGMLQCSVSYHSIVGDEKKQEFYASSTCKNPEELQRKVAENTLCFITASPGEKEGVAETLVSEYKKIFCVNSDNLPIIEALEMNVVQKERLSSEFLKETADSIAYLCDGLPSVALDVQGMYEVCGKDGLALLWAMVAYEFGILGAKETIGRLLVGIRY